MNGIFISQSGTLDAFYDLAESIGTKTQLVQKGLLVSHRRSFEEFRRRRPHTNLEQYHLYKEWDVTNNFNNEILDLSYINQKAEELSVDNFWEALVADRRLILGSKSTYFQDYKSRFTHEELLKILQCGLKEMDQLFKLVQPDFVSSFICVTMSEYLAYLYARSRKIPYLNLRTVRINNNMVLANHVSEPSDQIANLYSTSNINDFSQPILNQAYEIYSKAKNSSGKYEGITLQQKQTLYGLFKNTARKLLRLHRIGNVILTEYKIKYGNLKDYHDPGVIKPFLYETIIKPLRKLSIESKLKKTYTNIAELQNIHFCFFPLHLEPERILMISARYYMNQIEVVRNLAQSLPSGMDLVVKDHPKGFGRRSFNFYKKLLDIPNVKLISPYTPSEAIVQESKLVATIAGTVGWEAILRKKPVIILGPTVYEFLPDNMVKKVTNLNELSYDISQLLKNYEFQETCVIKYIAATLSESIPINFYSTLLSRENVVTIESNDTWDTEINKLSNYTLNALSQHD